MDHPAAPISPRRQAVWIAACLALAVLAVYGQVLHHEFLCFDDGIDVADNPYVRQGLTVESVRWALSSLEHANWQPLTRLSHLMVTELWGVSAPAGLAVNAALHALNAALLFLIMRSLTGAFWASAALAALWALHPLRVESVAWLTERKDVLSGLFWILTIGAYTRYARTRSPSRYAAALACYALGLMAKPMVITLPCVLLLLDWWPLDRRQGPARLLAEKVPFFVLAAGSALVTVTAHAQTEALLSVTQAPLNERLAVAAVAYLRYVQQTVWPTGLAAFYSVPPDMPPVQIAAGAVLLGCATLLVLALRRQAAPAAVGWLWFVGTLLPVIGLIRWGYHLHADRFTYLPAMGLTLAMVWPVARMVATRARFRPYIAAATGVILAVLSFLSWHQVACWQNFETLFSRAAQTQPNNWWALTALAGAHAAAGDHHLAIPLLRRALVAKPDFAVAELKLGQSLAAVGAATEAQRHLDRSLYLDQHLTAAYRARAELSMAAGRWQEAADDLSMAMDIEPDSAANFFLRGTLELLRGRPREAVDWLTRSLGLDPSAAGTYNNLAVALAATRRPHEARQVLAQGIARFPQHPELHSNYQKLVP